MNADVDIEYSANSSDALLGCLMLACRAHQMVTTRDALVAGMPLRNGKMTPALFKRAAERVNLSVTTLKRPLNQIRPEFLPVTLLLKDEDACVLTGIEVKTNSARVIYPELGDAEVLVPAQEILSRYTGYCIVTKPKFLFDRRHESL